MGTAASGLASLLDSNGGDPDLTLTPASSSTTLVGSVSGGTTGLSSMSVRRVRRESSSSSQSQNHRRSAHFSSMMKVASTPHELVFVGVEELKNAIRLWEEGLTKLKGVGDHDESKDRELETIIERARELFTEVEEFKRVMVASVSGFSEFDGSVGGGGGGDDMDDDFDSQSVLSYTSSATTATLPFLDVEPNIHFFRLYTQALDNLELIPAPRVDRAEQVLCESESEFKAKVHCLRLAFKNIFEEEQNRRYYVDMGREILEILLKHSLRVKENYFLEFVILVF